MDTEKSARIPITRTSSSKLSLPPWPFAIRRQLLGLWLLPICLLLATGAVLGAQNEQRGDTLDTTAAQPATEEAATDTEAGDDNAEAEQDDSQSDEESDEKSQPETDDDGEPADDAPSAKENEESDESATRQAVADKHLIGATAQVQEMQSGIVFSARVDTGAETCSLHVDESRVEDEDLEDMDANIGKTIRFVLRNGRDETHLCKAKIVNVVRIKNPFGVDRRYKVMLKLRWRDVEKQVEVSLTDRSEMSYPMLVGRNFLRGDFLVDVSKGKQD